MWAHRLLGKTVDAPQVTSLKELFAFNFVPIPGRGKAAGIKFPGSGDVVYSPEELVAMSLQHVRKIAKEDSGVDCTEAVITVPVWMGQKERQAVLDAAELAGLHVLDLVTDTSAAAITYGVERAYDLNSTHTTVFYDMGSAGTEAAVIQFTGVKLPRAAKVTGQAEIRGVGSDQYMGGLALDKVVSDYIVEQFIKKHGNKVADVRENPRAMAKVLKQANSAKMVLSANTEVPIKIESLHKDLDLVTSLSRDRFVELASSIFARVPEPIDAALRQAGMAPSDIDAVVIVGGSVRVPAVKKALKKYFGKSKLSQNINGDEAMAMGAAFRAANLSTSFQVRPFGILELTPYPVNVAVSNVDSTLPEFTRNVALFKAGNRLGKKKTVALAHNADVTLAVTQENLPPGVTPRAVTYTVTGVTALANDASLAPLLAHKGPRLSLVFVLGETGITTLTSAEALLEEPEDPAAAAAAPAAADGAAAPATPKEKKIRRIPLTVTVVPASENEFVQMSPADKTRATQVLNQLTQQDAARRALAAARNAVETQVYSMRNELSEPEIVAVTTEAQREVVAKASAAGEEWLYGEGSNADVAAAEAKLAELKALVDPIHMRKKEALARPQAINDANNLVKHVDVKVNSWKESRPWLTEEDTAPMKTLAAELAAFVKEKVAAQAAVEASATPAFRVSEIYQKMKPVTNAIARVEKKKRPPPPPAPTPAPNATDAAAAPAGAAAGDDKAKEQPADANAQQQQPTADGEAKKPEGEAKSEL